MKRFLIILLILLPVTAHADDEDWTISWKKGLRFDRNDGEMGIKLGGRIQEDFAGLLPSSKLQDVVPGGHGFATEFRRIRITLSGYFAKNVIFKTQYDFASKEDDTDTPGFKDAYIGAKNLPYLGTLLVGHMKEPLSLEMMESSNGLTFMERALPYAFVSDRNTGIRANNTALDQHLTWQFGVFVPT